MTEPFYPIGDSRETRALRAQIDEIAPFDEPVLVVGETGVGKELVARALHRCSPRAKRPLQAIHCAAVPAEMLAAELFGHRAGSFTGASRDRGGRIRAAEGGSVVLDEISETPESFQAAVLRVIEEGEIQPVGADTPVAVDTRFFATSNRPLADLADGQGFRRDLFHRLASFVIEIPPLRQRPDDLEPIARHLLDAIGRRYGEARALTEESLDRLRHHPFPGNVRELRQVLLRAYAFSDSNRIAAAALERALGHAGAVDVEEPPLGAGSLESAIRRHIRAAIRHAGGNLSEAARRLELPRSTLQHYLVKYRVDPEEDDADAPAQRRAAN